MSAVLEADAVRKVYRGGDLALVEVLNHVDLTVRRGEVVAIVGASGAGKSTLLHLLGALDEPTGGDIRLNGTSFTSLTGRERDELRNRQVGFVFQFHHLLREFTALENVMMPLLIAGWSEERAQARAEEILAAVDLAGRMAHRPIQLSGGEQQRCAVARAVVTTTTAIGSTTSCSRWRATWRPRWLSSPTTRRWPSGPTASCCCRTAASSRSTPPRSYPDAVRQLPRASRCDPPHADPV
jgi:lipoprotein-releasing system ATP-binding protein